MSVLLIILCLALAIFFPNFFWVFLLIAAGLIIAFYYRIKDKREEEEAERKRKIKESIYRDSKDPTHSHFYKTAGYEKKDDSLDSFKRISIYADQIYQGCPMVYRYLDIRVTNVNREQLRLMVKSNDFEVTLQKEETGDIVLTKYGSAVATLVDKVDMCTDWLSNGHPIICQFSAFRSGFERVALFFYKDIEESLNSHQYEIVKLSSYRSVSKQETISFLQKGQKLLTEFDDNDKLFVQDMDNNPIGCLPQKYVSLYEEDMVAGIFFDHSEIKPAKDFEKDDTIIPFVKIYFQFIPNT